MTGGAHSLVEVGSDQGQSFTPRAETTARARVQPGQQAGAAPRVCRGPGGQGQGQGQGLRGSLEDTRPIPAREAPAVVCGGLPVAEGTPPPLGLSFPAVTGEVGVRQSESPCLLPGNTGISDLREAWPGKQAFPEGRLRPEGQGLAFLLRLSGALHWGGVSRGRAEQAEGVSGSPRPIPHPGLHLPGPF